MVLHCWEAFGKIPRMLLPDFNNASYCNHLLFIQRIVR